MSASNNRILSIYKSRGTILEILSDNLGYDTTEYEAFSINEIDAMYSNSQLDMLLKQKEGERKVYIKYYLTAKQIRPQNLDDIIEDLFIIENVLTKEDTLVIITEDEPNDTITTKLKYLYDHDGIFVVIHNIRRLQFNILNHKLVPECTILQDNEIEELKKKHNITNPMQLPEISRFDPQALAMCLRPGNICEFKRTSATAMFYNYYRVCV
jgi:DNA-directed RNA polymerase subunit H (RpoH/RPB5)|uniref:RNA polymerase subunit H/Rpb5 C-terminal domain-containing protein n=1 Tax=viral metagenome TaxID=1070528 RepID=A0A6C0L773_9ZZZZ